MYWYKYIDVYIYVCIYIFIYTDFYANMYPKETEWYIYETSLMAMSGHMPWLQRYNLFIDMCYSI